VQRIGSKCAIRAVGVVAAGALAGGAAVACLGIPQASATRDRSLAPAPVTVRTLLSGAPHGWSDPDDLAAIGDDLFVGFQNGVPSTGGMPPGPTQSTIVKFDLSGQIQKSWQITGKCDGLGIDPTTRQVIATVNEDGNSSLWTIPVDGPGTPTHFTYDTNPLPHGGGTDSVTFHHGSIHIAASAPATAGVGPALYRLGLLPGGMAHLTPEFADNATATVANPGGGTVTLALSDPDSAVGVPADAPRFAHQFLLDSQGDQQLVLAAHLGAADQQLQVLNISQSVDDIAFPTHAGGVLVTTDAAADTVDVITGAFTPGTAYTAVTPGNANTPPVPTPNNYLGFINLNDGTVSPLSTGGVPVQPKGLIYLPPNSAAPSLGNQPGGNPAHHHGRCSSGASNDHAPC